MIFALLLRNGTTFDLVSCVGKYGSNTCRLMILNFHLETELGILPTAEFDGKTLSGNATIARYLAEENGKVKKYYIVVASH